MSRSLENLYSPVMPLVNSGVPVVVLSAFLWWTRQRAWWVMAFALVLLWLMYAVVCFMRTRATMSIDDDNVLHARRWFATHPVEPGTVVKVRELVNGRSPDVILHLDDRRKVIVPTSKLDTGHSTLFRWLQQTCPGATYDKGAQRLIHKLQAGGHLD